MADWMAAGRFHDALSLAYHPLYPLLVAAARPLAGGTEAAAGLVSTILGAAATAPLFLAARAIFGRPAAFFVALLYAFTPDLVELQSEPMTEGAYMFFLFSSLWLTWRMMESPSLAGKFCASRLGALKRACSPTGAPTPARSKVLR